MYKIFTLFFLLMFITYSCGTSQKATEEKVSTEMENEIYRFGVSFYSVGSAIDTKAKQAFVEFISEFETLSRVKLEYETTNWGREGETDYCFKLSELNTDEQLVFIQETKERLSTAKNVRFTENSACRTK